jgi:hypothetical protein
MYKVGDRIHLPSETGSKIHELWGDYIEVTDVDSDGIKFKVHFIKEESNG